MKSIVRKRVTMRYWWFLWCAILCIFVGITNAHRLEHHKWVIMGLDIIVMAGAVFTVAQSFKGNGLFQKD